MTASHPSSPAPPSAVAKAYRYDWQLFADWCQAAELRALPADPVTIALYLDENPAATNTHRVRLAAINSVHQRTGYPAPGTARALRDRLSRRTRPRPDLRDQARDVIAHLPTTGWPGGLFGRRDALLLVLSCYLHLSPAEIGRLRRSDIIFTGSEIHVRGGHDITVPADLEDPRAGTAPVYLRWARLQAFNDRHPTNRMVAESLLAATPVTDNTIIGTQPLPRIRFDGPLLPAFDRWGHEPLGRSGLSRHAVTSIASAHLSGNARHRPDRTVRHFDDGWTDVVEDVATAAYSDPTDKDESTSQFVDYTADELAAKYDAGIAARRAGAESMAELDDAFDDLDSRTAELLARTEALLAREDAPSS